MSSYTYMLIYRYLIGSASTEQGIELWCVRDKSGRMQ
jgi:hypothetical protein